MDQDGRSYPSDLTNQQWENIKELIPSARFGGRRRTTDVRKVINAIFYLTRSGCAWRYLPCEYPPWKTVYDYFTRWQQDSTWKRIHLSLTQQVRRLSGRLENPSTLIIDAQAVRSQYGEERGWDGFKKVRGRKREILVDTMGFIWGTKVHAANVVEQKRGMEAVYAFPSDQVPPPQRVLGDFSYSKPPFDVGLYMHWGFWPEVRKGSKPIVKKSDGTKVATIGDSNLKPQRWIVERSFAWFNNYRRLNRDYERKVKYSETFLYISQLQLILNRLSVLRP
jgi:putative transposase